MTKKVGICTYGRNETNQFYIPAPYVEAVRRAHGIPILFPPGQHDFNAWLDCIDAMIFTGGGDIDPKHYHGIPHECLYSVDHERDRTELALIKEVIQRQIPTLAICRGLQIVNVALGGKLYAHIPDVVGEKVKHRSLPREPVHHEIQLSLDSHLGRVLGQARFSAASWHHQSVAELAPDFRAVAHADDGVIEAIELAQAPWLLAVQWHPELSAAEDPLQQKLFDYLIQQ